MSQGSSLDQLDPGGTGPTGHGTTAVAFFFGSLAPTRIRLPGGLSTHSFSVVERALARYARPLMTLTSHQRQHLRALAHPLKPLVQIGAKGIGDGLVDQIAAQLLAHELIKVRFNTESAVEPENAAEELSRRTSSELVQHAGRTLVLYRRRDQHPKIELPRR